LEIGKKTKKEEDIFGKKTKKKKKEKTCGDRKKIYMRKATF